MDQQKQPSAPDTKTGAGVQSTQPQQQQGGAPEDQGNKKQAGPPSDSQAPLKEGNAPASGERKAL